MENEQLPDPSLTPEGMEQCQALRQSFPFHEQLTRIISSPLRRTLHTSIYVFGNETLYPVLALDTLQEVSDAPSDTGSDIEAIRREFGSKVDLSLVRQLWTDKTQASPFQADISKLETRAREARLAIRQLLGQGSNEHIAVVSHGDYMHFLTQDWQGVPEFGCKQNS